MKIPEGPWNDEPDTYAFIEESSGYVCFIRRANNYAYCGYCIIPTLDVKIKRKLKYDIEVYVHGGITYLDGNKYISVVGFDCGHAGDLVPKYLTFFTPKNDVYRDFLYVTQECRKLAKQLKKLLNE